MLFYTSHINLKVAVNNYFACLACFVHACVCSQTPQRI